MKQSVYKKMIFSFSVVLSLQSYAKPVDPNQDDFPFEVAKNLISKVESEGKTVIKSASYGEIIFTENSIVMCPLIDKAGEERKVDCDTFEVQVNPLRKSDPLYPAMIRINRYGFINLFIYAQIVPNFELRASKFYSMPVIRHATTDSGDKMFLHYQESMGHTEYVDNYDVIIEVDSDLNAYRVDLKNIN